MKHLFHVWCILVFSDIFYSVKNAILNLSIDFTFHICSWLAFRLKPWTHGTWGSTFPFPVASLVRCEPTVSPGHSCWTLGLVFLCLPLAASPLGPQGSRWCCVSAHLLLLPGMPLSTVPCWANANPSLRTDWGHLLSGAFPQMLHLFLLLPCSQVYCWLPFGLRSGVHS